MSLIEKIKADREAGTPQVWTAEKSACRDLTEGGWALVWDKTPGGRKNDDGTTSFAMRFPMLLASDWLGDPEHGMAVLADALNLAERADAIIPAAEELAEIVQAHIDATGGTDAERSALAAYREATA